MRTQFLAVLTVLSSAVWAEAQVNTAGIALKPGERLISVNGVPVNGAAATAASNNTVRQVVYRPATTGATVNTASAVATAANIVGRLTRTGLPFSHSPGATALDKANNERQRRGQRALIPDPALQQLALQKATAAAQRGYKNHIGGSLGGASCEGVGHTQGRFLTCCLDTPATYGGAAMVQGRDGWYCCLLVR